MKQLTCLVMTVIVALGVACAASTPPAPSKPPSSEVASSPASPTSSGVVVSHASTSAPVAGDPDDPPQSAGPIRMQVVLAAETPKASFPKATVGDRACWQDIGLIGDHQKDYEQVIAKCGRPTGMLEYAKPVTGRLHNVEGGDKHDKRDTFVLKLAAKRCYRFFAVADGSMVDMDIHVLEPNGALIATDQTKSPVAIVKNNEAWCVDRDDEYHFDLDVNAMGHGRYIFAVWARPKP